MSWRPKNWSNPYIYYGSPYTLYEYESNDKHKAFEADTDAILEALKQQNIPPKIYADFLRYGLERGNAVLNGKENDIMYKGQKGILLFIPDEEDEVPKV